MKYLPCRSGKCGHQPALATRAGLLHSAGNITDHQTTYICRRCGRPTTLLASEFVRLPDMTADEIAAKTSDMPYRNADDVPTHHPATAATVTPKKTPAKPLRRPRSRRRP